MIIMCDIDGVICDPSYFINKYLKGPVKPDWASFFKHTRDFAPVPAIITMLEDLRGAGHAIYFTTGRPKSNRIDTAIWIQENSCLMSVTHPATLFMRKDGDTRLGCDIKLDWALDIRPNIIFDDEDDTCEVLSGSGFTVVQVHGHRAERTRSDRVPA